MTKTRIILDTDIGTDVDDAFAIVQAAKVPDLALAAVTTVYGDVALRARLARKLLDLSGRPDVPVAAGMSQPLTPDKQVYWGGWEGEGFLTPEDADLVLDSRHGVDLIISLLAEATEPITLVAIGPLTNIAAVIQRGGNALANIQKIICMAGTIAPGEEEWNVQCDGDAAQIVFQSGLPIVLGTRFIVNQPRLNQGHRNRLAQSKNPAIQGLVQMLDTFLGQKQRASTPMYDPVTLSMAYTDQFIQTEPMAIAVQREAGVIRLVPQATRSPNMDISVSVRPEAFVDALVEGLMA